MLYLLFLHKRIYYEKNLKEEFTALGRLIGKNGSLIFRGPRERVQRCDQGF